MGKVFACYVRPLADIAFAVGFLWAVVVGWDAVPLAVGIPFVLGCAVVLIDGAGKAVRWARSERSRGHAPTR